MRYIKMSTFYESLGANAILAGVYVVYQLVNRCLHIKCRNNKEGGCDFDLGTPSAPQRICSVSRNY